MSSNLQAVQRGSAEQSDYFKKAAQAAYSGVLSFGATLANIGGKGAGIVSPMTKAPYKALKNKADPYLQEQQDIYQKNVAESPSLLAPRIGGELLGSAPLGGLFGQLAKAPGAVGSMLPRGLQTLGKYATAGLTGSAGAGAYGAMQYEPGQEGLLNMDRAKEYATNPIAPLLGMGGAALSTYGQRTANMASAQNRAFGAKVLNRDVKKSGKAVDMVFDSIPLIGGEATRLQQRTTFIPAVGKFVKSLSANTVHKTQSGTKNLEVAAQQSIKSATARITAAEKNIWKPINDVQSKIVLGGTKVQDLKVKAVELIDSHGAEISQMNPGLGNAINKLFIKSTKHNPTFEDLKSAKSVISEYLYGGKKELSRPAYQAVHGFLRGVYNNLDDSIAKVNPALVDSYHAANAFTASKHEMFNQAGKQFQNAVVDNANAYAFVRKLVTEPSPTKVGRMAAPFTGKELNTMRAGIINKHLKDSLNVKGELDLDKFLKLTSQEKNTKEIMGSTYQMLSGLREAMKPVQESLTRSQSERMGGSIMRTGQAAMLGGAAYGAMSAPGITGAIVGSVAAINYLANNSPVKKALISLTRARNNPKLLEALTKRVTPMLQRLGVAAMPQEDGSITIKKEGEE
jgi:hypothetical protein